MHAPRRSDRGIPMFYIFRVLLCTVVTEFMLHACVVQPACKAIAVDVKRF